MIFITFFVIMDVPSKYYISSNAENPFTRQTLYSKDRSFTMRKNG